VAITLEDANGITIGGTTGRHVFGIDGTWIGRSDRTRLLVRGRRTSPGRTSHGIYVYHL
jgi:hypothetical protein